jgi:hypothetical protein
MTSNLKIETKLVWIYDKIIRKFEIWNLYVKHLEFENLKIEMSKFGCVNIES